MNDATTFSVPCAIAEIKSRKDLTFALKLNVTRELSAQDGSALLSLLGKEGTMAFKESFTDEELRALPEQKPERNEKTPSQRLRAVLFRLWEQTDPEMVGDFESFYRSNMERIIESQKARLEP